MTRGTGASCGVVKRADGKEEVVVAGGLVSYRGFLDTVMILNLEQREWRSGENVNFIRLENKNNNHIEYRKAFKRFFEQYSFYNCRLSVFQFPFYSS